MLYTGKRIRDDLIQLDSNNYTTALHMIAVSTIIRWDVIRRKGLFVFVLFFGKENNGLKNIARIQVFTLVPLEG